MSHPAIRHHITDRFAAEPGLNVTPVYMSFSDLLAELTRLVPRVELAAVSLLLFVEQAVSERAPVFIASPSSSISRVVMQRRFAASCGEGARSADCTDSAVRMSDEVAWDGEYLTGVYDAY